MSLKNVTAGDHVRYNGELVHEDCDRDGIVVAIERHEASGDVVCTVEFDCGLYQDILASELDWPVDSAYEHAAIDAEDDDV